MKTFRLLAATLSVGAALAAFAPTTAHAQDQNKMMMEGKTAVVMAEMNDMDRYKMRWVFNNLDSREVKRMKAMGFSENAIKGAANIAMRTGLDVDYLLRSIKVSGYSLTQLATMFGVPTNVPGEDIPGMGMDTISMMSDKGMTNKGMMKK